MESFIDSQDKLFSLIKKGYWVITPNNRLSEQILQDFVWAQAKNAEVHPQILPYNSFLETLFNQFYWSNPSKLPPFILNDQQFHYLWRQILQKHNPQWIGEGLLKTLTEAWSRCKDWNLDVRHPEFETRPQSAQFSLLSQEFEKSLESLDLLTAQQILPFLLAQAQFKFPALVFACFDSYTPQQKMLQQRILEQGDFLYHYELEKKTAQIHYYPAKDEEDELQAILLWIKERLARGQERIAVIVPELQKKYHKIERLLSKHFKAQSFNISLGQSLASYPLVAHALNFLQLSLKTISAENLRLLLYSPYLAGSQTHFLEQAFFLEESLLFNEPQRTWEEVLIELKKKNLALGERLSALSPYPAFAKAEEWSDLFQLRLQELGFPGEYPLHSSQYQSYQRFLKHLISFKQLGLLSPSLSQEAALSNLSSSARASIFQPEKRKAAIQILGLLEASGTIFDAAWISGLSDQTLPQKPKPSPFIPLSLQQELAMPHADPCRELAFASKIFKRFLNSSDSLVLSYPALVGEVRHLPSPFIRDFPVHLSKIPTCFSLETPLLPYEESYQIPFLSFEKGKGGTALLTQQARCPFQAFAAHRLGAKKARESSYGPTAQERGQMLHRIMELLWGMLKSQANLLKYKPEQIALLIEKSIDLVLAGVEQHRKYSFSSLIQDVEKMRLKQTLHESLAFESQRRPFKVEALEKKFSLNLAGLTLSVRVDRLDQVEDGKKWVIDYKSNFPQSQPWKEERPQDPQLLLYALLDEAIDTLVFIRLKGGQVDCKGLSQNEVAISGISALDAKDDWLDYKRKWKTDLTRLAEEFLKGHCPPLPKTPSLCQHCDYRSLCRLNLA